MKSICAVTVFLIASFGFLFAQNQSAGNPPDNQHAHTTSVRGCLGGTAGAYTLSSGGTSYELAGNDELLSRLIGKEVKITGTKGSENAVASETSGNSGEATSNSSAGSGQAIKVSSATILSNHCGSGK